MSEQFQFDEEELAELRVMFFDQATELLDSLGELILRVEQNPGDGEALRAIRRAVHTLKGDSMAFGFTELTSLAHHYEDTLDKLRDAGGVASRALIDLLLVGADALGAIIKHYRDNAPLPPTEKLVEGLAALHHGTLVKEKVVVPGASGSSVPLAGKVDTKNPDDESSVQSTPDRTAPENRQIDLAAKPFAVGTPPEPAESNDQLPAERRGEADRRSTQDRRSALPGSQSMTLRIESQRVDAAMNLVGELIIQRSMISTITAELEATQDHSDLICRLNESVIKAARILSELQESVMRMRLVDIDQVFRRFPRVVRDASVKLGKPLRIEVAGGHVEIDKSIVELISDPLIHLVRNACDHGIELPAIRQAAGKTEPGVIKLKARRVGNQIAVEVEDDGAGIDPAKIVAKAIQKNLVTHEEIAEWTIQQKLGLIFAPGFSTKDQVSDLSGRGVGMDVVKTSVDSLGGSVSIWSVVGQGSRFTIRLPLTMAIVRAMLFECCNRQFALPLDSIHEITRLQGSEAKTIDGREVIRLREHVLPLIRLDEVLQLRDVSERDPSARLFVFVIELGDGREVGIAVEKLHREEELVLKTIDDGLIQSDIVGGTSILGDGSVVLILDANAIVRQASKNLNRERARCNRPEPVKI